MDVCAHLLIVFLKPFWWVLKLYCVPTRCRATIFTSFKVSVCVRPSVCKEGDFLSVLQLDKAAYLPSLLHTSQRPLYTFVSRIRAQLNSQTEETRIRAQVNATRREEGGVFQCASINGRTGGISSCCGSVTGALGEDLIYFRKRDARL